MIIGLLIIVLAETILFAYRTHKRMTIYRSNYYNSLIVIGEYDPSLKTYLENR